MLPRFCASHVLVSGEQPDSKCTPLLGADGPAALARSVSPPIRDIFTHRKRPKLYNPKFGPFDPIRYGSSAVMCHIVGISIFMGKCLSHNSRAASLAMAGVTCVCCRSFDCHACSCGGADPATLLAIVAFHGLNATDWRSTCLWHAYDWCNWDVDVFNISLEAFALFGKGLKRRRERLSVSASPRDVGFISGHGYDL